MLIGLTGNIASGKSTAAALLKDRIGAAIVDADALGRYLRETNTDIQRNLVMEFGTEILDERGRVSRKKLGDLVFSNPVHLSRMNGIFFPVLTYEVWLEIKRAQKMFNHVILDAALILEWGMQKKLDTLIVVTAPPEIRLQRLMVNRRLLEEDAEKRIKAQASEEFKIAAADVVIANSGTLEALNAEVEKAVQKLELG